MKKLITPIKFVAPFFQRFFCLLLLLVFVSRLHSQTLIKVSGTVMDAENNKPLAGVSAGVKGGNITTATDANGNYTLNVNSNATLVFSYVGYAPEEIQVSGKNIINIALHVN